MSDLINGREMLMRLKKDLCYGIACKECSMCTEDGGCRVEEWIDKFPSADRPKGEWVKINEIAWDAPLFECSSCGIQIGDVSTHEDKPRFPYCPWCGAKMKGADDETD